MKMMGLISFCRQHLHGVEMDISLRTFCAEDDGRLLAGIEGEDTKAVCP
jgi:hypothetical protein